MKLRTRATIGIGVGLLFSIIAAGTLAIAMVVPGGVALAAHDGFFGDEVCRDVQLEAQAAVAAGGPYKNHGQEVQTAANVVSPREEAGDIDADCASCIMHQFARGDDPQLACGPDRIPDVPECEAATCQTFITCNAGGNCGNDGVCVNTDATQSGGTCVAGSTPCAGLTACPGGTSECAAGSICAFQTCCGAPVCVPPEAFCFAAGAASAAAASATDGSSIGNE